MILTAAEVSLYAPTCQLTGAELTAALYQAQIIAEGPAGANRPLEKTTFIEHRKLTSNFTVKVSRLPFSDPITVQVRGGTYTTFNLTFVGFDWNTINSDDYLVDHELGEIRLRSVSSLNLYSQMTGSTFSRPGYKRRPTSKSNYPEARLTYTTGFDFSDDSDPVVRSLKYALGGIVTELNDPSNQGTKEFELTDFYTFSTTGTGRIASKMAKSSLEEYLQIFRKYSPREVL